MKIGYNTNGFAHHRLEDAIPILADLGYEAVAITLDFHALNPFADDLHRQMNEVRKLLVRHQLACVIETGSRFLLDTKRKHQPTLVSPEPWERDYRAEFLRRSLWVAASLGAQCISLWSGTPVDDLPNDAIMNRLYEGLQGLCDEAETLGVVLAFEPEPGMFIDTTAKYEQLAARINRPQFKLTLDIGHLHCMNEPIADTIRRHRHDLVNVHLDDMKVGIHDHLMFGDGEIEFGPVLNALHEIGFEGVGSVELSRHSHDAVATAKRALKFLRQLR